MFDLMQSIKVGKVTEAGDRGVGWSHGTHSHRAQKSEWISSYFAFKDPISWKVLPTINVLPPTPT